ncbi:NAD(P)-binding protein [Mycena rebaudengoi]|nr:NAD(P)-binding protein [Mycena rebaudengoi]
MTITQEPSAPLVAVVGATGVQGGSVVKALAASHRLYRVRGFTRDTTKQSAQELVRAGVEVAALNIHLQNVDAVHAAFRGADMAFLMTNFWDHCDKQREIDEGKLLIDAVKSAGVSRVVWSGLESPSKVSNGKYVNVLHFDGKAEVTEYGMASGVPLVNVEAGFYAENIGNLPAYRTKEADGTVVISWPINATSILPVIDAGNDYGLFVLRALEAENFPAGTDVCTTSEDITIGEMVRQLADITGIKIVYRELSYEETADRLASAGTPPFLVVDMVEAFKFCHEYGLYGGKIHSNHAGLIRPPHTWSEFVKVTDWVKVFGN